jgi:redox-regulated HSP33 family molecular chaperone
MAQHDQLHRYLFEQFAVRGELVTVSETWKQILEISPANFSVAVSRLVATSSSPNRVFTGSG